MKYLPLNLFAFFLFFAGCNSPDKQSTDTQEAAASVPEDNGDFYSKDLP